MKNNTSILVIDDDPQICDLLQDFLQQHGCQVFVANETKEVKNIIDTNKIDLLIIDIMLPYDDGLSLCRKIRKDSNLPIIILSALGDDVDRIVGLEVGADDYLAKPFNPRELLARIKALLRRVNYISVAQQKIVRPKLTQIHFANWILDQQHHYLITTNGLKIPLSKGEFDLLSVFIEHMGHILSRDQLLDLTKGKEYLAYDRSIDVQVGRLRKKLESDPKDPKIIVTVRNVGYKFSSNVEYKHS